MTITQTATGLNSIRARMVDWQRRWLSRVEASLAHCRTMAAYPTALAVLEVEDSIAARTQDGIRLECLTLLRRHIEIETELGLPETYGIAQTARELAADGDVTAAKILLETHLREYPDQQKNPLWCILQQTRIELDPSMLSARGTVWGGEADRQALGV